MAAGSNVGFATLQVIPSTRGFSRHMRQQLGGTMRQAGQQAGSDWGSNFDAQVRENLDKLGSFIGRWSKRGITAIGAIGGAITGLALKGGIDRALNIEDAQAKLRGLGHDTEAVRTIMDSALSSVKGTAFGLDEAATIAAGAVAAGIKPGEDLTRVLKLTADAATIAGVPLSEMGQIFGQVIANGRAMTLELTRLQDRGIPIMQWLADEFGVTQEAMREMVADGVVDSERYLRAIENNIAGAALASGETTRGAFANVRAALSRLVAGLFEPFQPLVRDAFQGLIGFIDGMAERIKPAFARFLESDTFAAIEEFVARLPEHLENAVDRALALWDATKGIRTTLGLIISGGIGIIESNLGKAAVAAFGLRSALQWIKANPATAALGAAFTVGSAVVGAVRNRAEEIQKPIREAKKSFDELSESMKAEIFTEAINEAWGEENVRQMEQFLNRSGRSISDFTGSTEDMAHLIEISGQGIGDTWELIEQKVNSLEPERLTRGFGPALRQVAAEEQAAFEERVQSMDAFVQDMNGRINTLREFWAERFEDMIGSAASFITGLAGLPEQVNITMDEFESNLLARTEAIDSWFHNLRILTGAGLDNLVQEAVREGPEKMAGLVEEWANDLNTARNQNEILRSAQELVRAGTADLVDSETWFQLIQQGRRVPEGFAQGIDLYAWLAEAAARQMARAAINAVSSEARIESPAKAFEELGYQVPAGFAQGIDRRTSMVEDAARRMARAAVPDLASVEAGLAGLTPRIEPTDFDLSALESAGRIQPLDPAITGGRLGGGVEFHEGAIQVINPTGEPFDDTLAAAPLAYSIERLMSL